MPEIVTEVSAMFVDKMNLRTPLSAGAKAFSWSSGGIAAYNARTSKSFKMPFVGGSFP